MNRHSDDRRRTNRIAYWPFDDGSGTETTEALEETTYRIHHASEQSGREAEFGPRWVDGVSNAGLLFDGYSTWVSVPIGTTGDADGETDGVRNSLEATGATNGDMDQPLEAIDEPLSALTVEAWVAPRSFVGGASPGSEDRAAAVLNRHDAANERGFEFGVSEHGALTLGVGLGDAWERVRADADRLPTGEWSHVVGVFDRQAGELALYLNGDRVASASIDAGAEIQPADDPLRIGKNNHPSTVDGVFDIELFDGVVDELELYCAALTASEITAHYRGVLDDHGGEHPDLAADAVALDRGAFDADPDRPRYHVRPPGHWMNEPHAPVCVDGQYHLFYQRNPAGPYFHHLHWGHWVSDDMVHWRNLPVALAPEADAINPDGAWSGSATRDTDGSPALVFTAGDESETPNQSIGLARPARPPSADPEYTEWSKLDEPVIEQPRGIGLRENDFRDPHVWREGDEWFCLVGSGIEDGSGTALVYRTEDLERWRFRGHLYRNDRDEYPELGHVWELPVLLPLGTDGDGDRKHVFVVSPEGSGAPVEVYYWVGEWDSDRCTFTPDDEDPQLIDYGDFHFTGPSGFVDPQTGRSILFTIAQDLRSAEKRYETGYAHNGGLPVELFLHDDGDVGVRPIEELQSLRGERLVSVSDASLDAVDDALAGVGGDMLEIALTFGDGDASRYGLDVRKTPDGSERTRICYDEPDGEIRVHRERSTLDRETRAQMARRSRLLHRGGLDPGDEALQLRVFLDKSMVECYASARRSVTTRVYPTRDDATGLDVWADGSIPVASLDVWEMNGY
ncbi:MAG: GH32 C-terminal domain-containing protein [Haloarculaceae archaeon]